MKKLVLALIITINLFAQDEKPQATQLELFLFKIGFNSLLNDYNNSKSDISNNSEKIKELDKKMDFIITKLNQLSTEDKLIIDKKAPTINTPKNIEKVPKIVNKNIEIITNTENDDFAFVGIKDNELFQVRRQNGINLYSKPNREKAVIVRTLEYKTIIKLDGCNKFDWCKIKDKEEYIPKYLVKRYVD